MAKVRVQCSACSQGHFVDEAFLGRTGRCKKCNQKFTLQREVTPAGRRESEPPAVVLVAPEVLLEEFIVEKKLGEGGMGTVVLVRSQTTSQRFAVKKTKLRDEKSRRNFLIELQTWLELPEHPHLTACRFFRTAEDQVLVFAEYVDGGSLHDWVRERKLTRLEQILNVAIQFAWGLHAAHEAGLVHQDVKPGNVLLKAAGQVKVTDFGLARARGMSGASPGAAGASILVSSGGMTRAYCSPEQAAGRPLSRKTDIWSWGVSVLEMFAGEVTWQSGTAALEVLENLLADGPVDDLPPVPAALADVLRRCFRQAPLERWANLEEAARRLEGIYREETGKAYSRFAVPLGPGRPLGEAVEYDRQTADGGGWTDPRTYLEEALREAGRDPKEAETMLPPRGSSRKGQAIADLAVYDEARRLFQQLVAAGRKDLENRLATLCHDKGLVHKYADDMPGALALYEQAIALWERLVNQEGRRKLAPCLANVYSAKASALRFLGDNRAALAVYDQAMALWERLVNQEGQHNFANHLAGAYTSKASAVRELGDGRAAVALNGRAIAIYERLVHQEGRRELASDLAAVYMNQAVAVTGLGDHRGALALYDQAIAILEGLFHDEGRHDLAHDLAKVYTNKAAAAIQLGDNRSALPLLDRAIAVRELLVNQDGRRELAHELASSYGLKAIALNDLGDFRAAAALYDQGIAIYERLVNQEGRRELANDLANIYMNKANTVGTLGDNRAAAALYDRAIAIRERLVHQEGRRELADDLADVYMNKANTLSELGDKQGALALHDQAIAIRERLVHQEGRRELAHELAKVYTNKAGAVNDLGDNRAAVALYDKAIAIFERLVNKEGRAELADDLAAVYMNKGIALSQLQDKRGAVALFGQALAIRERLVNQEGRQELRGEIARVLLLRAATHFQLGKQAKGETDLLTAMAILQEEIARTGRPDLQAMWDWAKANFSGI